MPRKKATATVKETVTETTDNLMPAELQEILDLKTNFEITAKALLYQDWTEEQVKQIAKVLVDCRKVCRKAAQEFKTKFGKGRSTKK